jgi:hypothetical protein
LRITKFAAKGAAELEMARESRRSKVVKYWLRILYMDNEVSARVCCE